jgi:hypothetical protein
LALVSLFVLGTSLFFGAEYLTRFLYQQKLQEIRNNFTSLSIALNDINGKLNYLDQKMDTIEEKERAVRTYANLPEIDQGVRSLGIGGLRLEKYTSQDYIIPGLSKKISGLELEVDHLARKVKLELVSFETIYDKVVKDTEKMKHIPSIRPVPGGYLNSGFGYRKDPIDGVKRFHKGLDFSVYTGTPIYAPADGYVISKDAEVAQNVVASTPILQIVDPNTLWVATKIDERVSANIKIGQSATITLRSQPNKIYKGVVKRINAMSDAVTLEREIDVAFIEFPKPFYMNEQAKTSIDIKTYKETVLLPANVVVQNGGTLGVWIAKDSHAHFLPLKIIAKNDTHYGVSNLELNTKIIIPSADKKPLSDGMKIH